jgi:hypothetical protein
MAKKNSKQSRKKAQWERGYFSHGYWLGKAKLGEVKLGPKGEWDGRYRWQAGNRAGESLTLDDAKRAVETMTELGEKQLGLFEDQPDSA